MKTKITKIILLTLVLVMAVAVLVSCGGKDKSYTITVMDGETEVGTFKVADGEKLDMDFIKGKLAKEGFEFVGLYTDENLTNAFVAENEIVSDLTLYVKYTTKQLYISYKKADGTTEKIAVTKGASYEIAAPTKEGYTFDGFTYENDDDEEVAFATSGTYNFDYNVRLTAKWKLNEYTVTYKNGTESIGSEKVNHNAKTTGIDSVAGYTIEGYYTDEEMTADNKVNVKAFVVTADTTLYVKLVPNTYHITVVNYDAANCDVQFGATYTLPAAPMKEGWASFDGYKLGSADGETFEATGTYTWTSNIVVYATYTRDEMYNKSTVTLLDDNTQVGTTVVEDGSKIDEYLASINTEKAGYTFYGWYKDTAFESKFIAETDTVNTDLTLHAKYVANEYTIIVIFDNEYYEEYYFVYGTSYTLPAAPAKPGYVFNKYTYGGNDFAASGTYTYTSNIEVAIVWDIDTSLFVNHGNYFTERETPTDKYTYVFLTGVSYTFQSAISTTDGSSYISRTDDKHFVATNVGEFTITITPDSGEPYTRNAKVVKYVNTFNDNYSAVKENAVDGTIYQTIMGNYVMDVGLDNFIPDVSIKDNANGAITLAQANATITVTDITDANDPVALSAAQYALVDNRINFVDPSLVGKTVAITMAPKYDVNNAMPITITATLNNGVNVYNNSQLKTNYANPAISKINILRNITAEFAETDYDLRNGGHGAETGTVTLSSGNISVNTGTPYNDYAHGVYTRTTNIQNDSIVVNGNYFEIDGSKLPYIDNAHDKYGAEGSKYAQGNGYHVANVQIGIFLYRCVQLDGDGDVYIRYATGEATINNLRIRGNNTLAPDVTEALADDPQNPLLKMSASIIGIVLRGGTMNVNNVTIEDTCMGFMLDGNVSGYHKPGVTDGTPGQPQAGETQSVKLNMNSCIINNSWANSLYMFGLSKSTLTNSKLGNSSGAAIHVHDRPYIYNTGTGIDEDSSNGYSNLNCELYLDSYTAKNINNWVSGGEAWFVAYNFSMQAVGARQQIDQYVKAASSNAYTIVKNDPIKGDTMNFAILVAEVDNGWSTDEHSADNHNGQYLETRVQNYSGFSFFYGEDENVQQAITTGTPYVIPDLSAFVSGISIYVTAHPAN